MSNSVDYSIRSLLSRRFCIAASAILGIIFLLRIEVDELSQFAPPNDRMAAELVRAAERAGICSAANAVGVGLRGEYFAEPSLRGLAGLVRVDGTVDFDRSLEWPTSIAERPLSVRWSGWVKAPLSGRYHFHADGPNMQILVGRNLVAGVGAAPNAKLDLAAGRFYPIDIIVNQLTDSDKRIRLEWTAPHGARYVVPKALLHLPTETVATPRI